MKERKRQAKSSYAVPLEVRKHARCRAWPHIVSLGRGSTISVANTGKTSESYRLPYLLIADFVLATWCTVLGCIDADCSALSKALSEIFKTSIVLQILQNKVSAKS